MAGPSTLVPASDQGPEEGPNLESDLLALQAQQRLVVQRLRAAAGARGADRSPTEVALYSRLAAAMANADYRISMIMRHLEESQFCERPEGPTSDGQTLGLA
jgi:hypothetical protein